MHAWDGHPGVVEKRKLKTAPALGRLRSCQISELISEAQTTHNSANTNVESGITLYANAKSGIAPLATFGIGRRIFWTAHAYWPTSLA
jgi:hypothetical protein